MCLLKIFPWKRRLHELLLVRVESDMKPACRPVESGPRVCSEACGAFKLKPDDRYVVLRIAFLSDRKVGALTIFDHY